MYTPAHVVAQAGRRALARPRKRARRAPRRGRGAPPAPAGDKALPELIATVKATRERSRQSFDRVAACDPGALRFKHFRLGELDLAQWWRLAAEHDRVHLGQVRDVKRAPGFPAA